MNRGGVDVARAFALRAQIARERDGQEVVTASDPATRRHDRELFGVADDPDFTPPEARYVQPKRVLLEWVGQPSPFTSPVVLALKAKGLLTPIHRIVLERAALLRIARVDGVTSRTLTKERDGMSETHRWGPKPGTFVREVPFADARRILDGPSGAEFRIAGSHADASGPVEADSAWVGLLRALSKREGLPDLPPDAERLRLRHGTEEGLKGLHPRSNLLGVWR